LRPLQRLYHQAAEFGLKVGYKSDTRCRAGDHPRRSPAGRQSGRWLSTSRPGGRSRPLTGPRVFEHRGIFEFARHTDPSDHAVRRRRDLTVSGGRRPRSGAAPGRCLHANRDPTGHRGVPRRPRTASTASATIGMATRVPGPVAPIRPISVSRRRTRSPAEQRRYSSEAMYAPTGRR